MTRRGGREGSRCISPEMRLTSCTVWSVGGGGGEHKI